VTDAALGEQVTAAVEAQCKRADQLVRLQQIQRAVADLPWPLRASGRGLVREAAVHSVSAVGAYGGFFFACVCATPCSC
jgi:hypothetical protein